MEYEILDEPQGEKREDAGTADAGLIEDPIALRNGTKNMPEEYPGAEEHNPMLLEVAQ